MRIGTAESEGVQTDDPSGVLLWKSFRLRGHAKFQPLEINVRARILEVEARGNLPMLPHEQRFHQADHTSSRLKGTHVRLCRNNRQRLIFRTIRAERFGERRCLDGIPHRRPCAVRLDETDLRWIDARIHTCIAHEARLRLRTRQLDSIRVAVLIQRRAEDHAMNGISVCKRFAQRL